MGALTIEMQALNGLMNACVMENRTSKAIVYGEQLVNKARTTGNHEYEVQAIFILSDILAKNSKFEKQIKHLLQGLEVAQKNPDMDWGLNFLSELGIAYYQMDDLENALKYTDQAKDLADRFKKKNEAAVLSGRLASIKADLGDLDASTALAQEAIALSEELEIPMLAGQQYVILAMNFNDLGETALAKEHIQRAIDLYRSLDQEELLNQAEKVLESFG